MGVITGSFDLSMRRYEILAITQAVEAKRIQKENEEAAKEVLRLEIVAEQALFKKKTKKKKK